MKRISLFYVLFVGLIVLFFANTSYAQGLEYMNSGTSNNSAPLLGNDHKYSVTAKASGILVVNAKIVLVNNSENPKTDFSFQGLEGVKGKVSGYQQIKGKKCKSVDYTNKKCLEFEDPDYVGYPYSDTYDEVTKYHNLSIKTDGGNLSASLPVPIEPYKATAVVFSYYLSGSTKSLLFGQKSFIFNTLQDEEVIKNVTVSVDTDSDLYTKGRKSSVSSSMTSSSTAGLHGVNSLQPTSSKALDTVIGKIGSYGDWMNKTGKDILPGETFKVSGSYSTTWFGLYWKSLLIVLLVILFFIGLVYLLIRKARSTKTKNISRQNNPQLQTDQKVMTFREAATFKNFLWAFLVLFISTGFVFGWFRLNMYMMDILGDAYWVLTIMDLILVVIVATAVIGYPIYIGIKKGLFAGLIAILSYVVTAVIICVCILVGFALFSGDTNANSGSNVHRDFID